MASILVIGVGSTGLAAMERAQQFYYEFTKKNSPGTNSAFMYLETQGDRKPETTPDGETDITACYLCPNNITATLKNWEDSKQWNWLPSDASVLNTHSGAAGQPAYGRVSLWEQETNVRNTLSQLYAKIGGDASTNIYVVGSLTGGTGTGIFLDIAYMVRQCTHNNNIYGMFMLPDRRNVGNSTMDMIYENAYSSLRSLDKFSKIELKKRTNYKCILPGGTDISNLCAPFYNVQFFTQDFSNASASLVGLPQLVQSVGFNLVLRMLDVDNQQAPFQALINAKLVDYTSNVPDGIFTTIGLNMFQYPESLLEEYITTKLLVEKMLNRWSDTQNYFDNHGAAAALTTLNARIKSEALRFVHEAIEDAVTKCMGHQFLGKSTFKVALEGEIAAIQSGNYQAPSLENYIYSLYDANSQAANKFYAAIAGQSTTLRDALIESIAKKIEEVSTTYQNLIVVQTWLQQIADALDNVSKDWLHQFKIDGTPSKWNNCWSDLQQNRLSGKLAYALTGTVREWYYEALMGAATLCYYNAFIPMLHAVQDAMLNRNGSNGISTAAGVLLPTQNDWRAIAAKVAKLLNSQDNQSITSRMENLHGQMVKNSNSQINFLFNGNSCDDDIKVAEGKYQNDGKHLAYSDLSHDSLWRFLYANDVVALRGQMISRAMSFIQQMNLFANTDIVQIMTHLQPNHPTYNKVNRILTGMPAEIEKDVPAMASLINTEQFADHNCLKLIVASPLADNNAAGIVAQMQNFKPSPNASNYVQLPSMKNTVVIYQEYGYLGMINGIHKAFNPLIHLSYQPQVLRAIQTKLENNNFDESVRLAYIDKATLVDTANIKIK